MKVSVFMIIVGIIFLCIFVGLLKLEEQKTELENTDYVAVARSFKLTPQQLADFLKSQQAAPSETVLPQEKEDVHEA